MLPTFLLIALKNEMFFDYPIFFLNTHIEKSGQMLYHMFNLQLKNDCSVQKDICFKVKNGCREKLKKVK